MDPIFVALNQTPRVFVVAGYVDDTTVVGHQEDAQWVEEVFKYVKAWTTAGIVMDIHDCWQVGFFQPSREYIAQSYRRLETCHSNP